MDTLLPVTTDTLATATLIVLGYLVAMFLGARFLPGIERDGYDLPIGDKKRYSLTGMTLWYWVHLGLGVFWALGGSLSPLISHFWSLFIVTNVVAVIITGVLYLQGRREGTLRMEHGTGLPLPHLVKDLWFGNELNPVWFGVDVKMFMYQPSLIGVYLFVLAFANLQFDQTGTLTPQMVCFVAFWNVYLWTHYVKEEFMLSTWDVIAENFGFMLVWGDLVYVPYLYCLPGWWIAAETTPWPTWAWASLAAFATLSMVIFRTANWQKERYKRDREALIWGRKAEAVGGRLLVSGWWGVGRKFNYTGEIGVYLAFSLCAGFDSLWPHLLPLSLIILLAQRAARDDAKCRSKYGELWEQYCARVKFRMVPFIY